MGFFDERQQVGKNGLHEHVFMKHDMCVSLNYIKCLVSGNGGNFLLIKNFGKEEEIFFNIDSTLKDNFVVYQSDFMKVNFFQVQDKLIGMFFMKDERIVAVKSNGDYFVYNCYLGQIKSFVYDQILQQTVLRLDGSFNKIRNISSDGESFLLWTSNNQMQLVYDLDQPQIMKINLKMNVEISWVNFGERSWQYYYDNNKKKYYLFIACLKNGILQIELDKNNQKNKILFADQKEQFVKLYLSPNKRSIALLTIDYNIYVYNLQQEGKKKYYKLDLTEREKETFEECLWIGELSLAINFKRYLKFIFNSEQAIIDKQFKSGFNDGQSILFCRSEIDGLRIIQAKKISTNVFTFKNIMLRNQSEAHKYLKGMIYFTPGRNLYESYKSLLQDIYPTDKNIINDQKELEKGVEEILEAVKFELVQKKQKKFLKAASFGKLFIEEHKKN